MHDCFNRDLDFKVGQQTVLNLHLSYQRFKGPHIQFQHSLGRLCPMNQLNEVQNKPQQLHDDQHG